MVEFRRGLAIAVLSAACFGCATAPPPPPPPVVGPVAVVLLPRPLSESEIESAVTFLQLEDRREFRTDVFEAAAVAPEASIRARAVYAAGRIAAAESSPFVRRFLSDSDTSVAAAAAFAAGHLRDTTAVPLLAALLEPQQAAIRSTVAAEAASSLGTSGLPAPWSSSQVATFNSRKITVK